MVNFTLIALLLCHDAVSIHYLLLFCFPNPFTLTPWLCQPCLGLVTPYVLLDLATCFQIQSWILLKNNHLSVTELWCRVLAGAVWWKFKIYLFKLCFASDTKLLIMLFLYRPTTYITFKWDKSSCFVCVHMGIPIHMRMHITKVTL